MPLLSVRDLSISFTNGGSSKTAVSGVSFDVKRGEIVGLVGESGSGKTITSLALMRLLDEMTTSVRGSAVFNGQELLHTDRRGNSRRSLPSMSMIFQEPMTALDPVFTIGSQIIETLAVRQGLKGKAARAEAISLLESVGISDPVARLRAYPHELSGGMRQRVMIAIALACDPELLIADEPTTAVDTTIQAQLLDLIMRLAKERSMAVIFVTHDLGVIAETCDRLLTMYAGEIVEDGWVSDVLRRPRHPYTAALLNSRPTDSNRGERLPIIPGRIPSIGERPEGCVFAPRCQYRTAICAEPQSMLPMPNGASVRCVRAGDLVLTGVTKCAE